jgi:c-di-GMP-binding flagellar brake protein YcgR
MRLNMLQDIISIGDKIDIKFINHNDKQLQYSEKIYVSQLVNYVDYDTIDIVIPMRKRKIYFLEAERTYHICFYTNKGLYQSKCVVINTFKDNNILTCRVKLTADLEKYQRRQYYRLECFNDIQYRIITREEEILYERIQYNEYDNALDLEEMLERLDQIDQVWNKGCLINLSGGGVRFNSKLAHQQEDKMFIKIGIEINGNFNELKLKSTVIAVEKLINRSGVYAYRVQFYDISSKERESLIKFIFEQERQRRGRNRL